ncbi:MAG: nuclear transport factor 2 family protein [Acidobacteriota bacterium]|nr:nuclear transport factor 2 family protein [Acidobacteriota bacterium]
MRAFVAAFNARDIEAMLALADDAIEWISVDGAKLSTETAGKAALRSSMTTYFKSCPTCRSSVEIGTVSADRVTALETAMWTAAGVERAQRGVSVYEFAGGRIRRVYYFPVEK